MGETALSRQAAASVEDLESSGEAEAWPPDSAKSMHKDYGPIELGEVLGVRPRKGVGSVGFQQASLIINLLNTPY